MPAACQHFPRVVLIDARGVFVTLSNYCPTAAALLMEDNAPVSIVEGPPALPNAEVPEGLDARDALPPLRSPRLLMDLDEYSAWERDTIAALTTTDAPDEAVAAMLGAKLSFRDRELFDLARACVPPPYSWPAAGESVQGNVEGRLAGRFLAAHAFACWMAYQGNGLLATALYLRLVLAVLRIEAARQPFVIDAIRQSDLLLRHLIDREALAARVSALVRDR